MNEFVTVESLNRFDNDPIVSVIMDTVKQFRGYYNKGAFDRDPHKLMSDKKVKLIIQGLEDALAKRFGMRFRLLLNATAASIFYVPTHDFAGVGKAYNEYYRALEKYFADSDSDTDFKNISDGMYKAVYESARSIRDAMIANKPIKLDEKKAIVTGLPKDTLVGALNIGFYYLFIHALTDAEITAVMMHEIGHGFTSLSTMNESFTSVIGITEVLKETKNDKKKVISLVEETYGVKLTDSGTAVEYIIANQLFKNAGAYSTTNNEAAADTFVARFGLSVEISTALAKLRLINVPDEIRVIHPPKIAEIALIAKMMEDTDSKVRKRIRPILALAAANDRSANLHNAIHKYHNPDTPLRTKEFTYDAIEGRIERLKRDVIRQLRTLELSEKQKDGMVKEVKALEIMVHEFSKKYKPGPIWEVLVAWFDNAEDWRHRKLYRMIEDMVENDLHYQKEKFKLLKGK